MWQKIKLFFTKIKPDLLRFLKAAIKMAIDILLPIALDAVVKAEAHGGTGNEKFNYALEYMQKEVPDAAIGKVKSAIQDAWLIKEAEGWK